MNKFSPSTETGAPAVNAKATYAAPKLTTYGNISELTGGASAGMADGMAPGAESGRMMM